MVYLGGTPTGAQRERVHTPGPLLLSSPQELINIVRLLLIYQVKNLLIIPLLTRMWCDQHHVSLLQFILLRSLHSFAGRSEP